MSSNRKNLAVTFLCLGLLCSSGSVRAASSFWEANERKAIEVQNSDPNAAVEMYRLAIKDAASENAPIEKRLGLLLGCGNVLFSSLREKEAREVYEEGASLAAENHLPNWQARFLVMSSLSGHMAVIYGQSNSNDPAPALKALELRPGKPNQTTDFHVNCLEAIGNAYLDSKDYPNAEKYLKQALAECERLPDSQDIVDEITRSYLQLRIRQQKYGSATALLVAALESHPREKYENKLYFFHELSARDPVVSAIRLKADTLLKNRDFDGLDAYASELRASKNQLANGDAPIDEFMGEMDVQSYLPESEIRDRVSLINDWIEKNPTSPTAKIALANVLVSYAWKARGDGWASDVSEAGWEFMGKRLDQAWRVLYRVTNRTPDWYSVAQRIAMGQNWSRSQYDTLVATAQKTYPTYNEVLFHKAYWLQPKWFGQPGEAKRFIEAESNKHPGIDGDVMYAQFAWQLDFSFPNVIKDAGFDWTRVKRGMNALIKKFPQSLTARAELAYLGGVMGDKPTALSAFPGQADYDVPVKMRPRGYLAALEEGRNFQHEDKRPEAIAAYTKAIGIDPKSPEAYYRRAEMFVMTNKHEEALKDINTCLAMFPAWIPALAERGRIENVCEEYERSIADIEKVISLNPSAVDGLTTLGHDYDALGDHQRALNTTNHDVELTEQNNKDALYYAYQDRGLCWSNAHQFDDAVSDLTHGLQLRPKWSQMWAYLAYVYAATDQLQKAQDAAKALFATEKFPPRGYRLRAEMYRAGGHWEEALADYDKSTSMEPTYGPGFWQRAVTEIALGKYDSAEVDLNKSVALIPTSAWAHSYLAYAQDLNGKKELSQQSLAKAFALTPNLPMNYVNRARIELQHGELAKAAADCEKALSLDPYLGDAYATASDVLAKAGKTTQSLDFAKTARTMWWHPWPVPLSSPAKIEPTEIAIAMPKLNNLQPQPFAISLRDAAP